MTEAADRNGGGTNAYARFLGFLKSKEIRDLLDYWRRARKGRLMPSKSDIRPEEIPWALSRVFLLDYGPDSGFRYRLAGADVARMFRRSNLKGLGLTDILPAPQAELVTRRWMPIVQGPCVLHMRGMVYFAAERVPLGERLLMPLSDDESSAVTGVLGMTVFEWVSGPVADQAKLPEIESILVGAIP